MVFWGHHHGLSCFPAAFFRRDPERYGIAKDALEKQVDEFTRSYTSDDSAKAASCPEWTRNIQNEECDDTGRLLAKA
jgi:hypothetical protein